PSDIRLVVEPVVMQPLRRTWEAIQAQAEPLYTQYQAAKTARAKQDLAQELAALRDQMLASVRSLKVLDPACGSGNFLYVTLGLLRDLEHAIVTHPFFVGKEITAPQVSQAVHPSQLYGLEINPIAHALASIVVWIGYMQWRYSHNLHDYPT